ncbi:G patch domain and ankyrin repeat-containing protein 1-like [Babylonia areolata]|uniref:G patch domain and ankyrin repeat-containing protein 1-like n=1 Tax=Babylonia areolata TaxID=304850 RepID=UPI003FD5F89C
MASFSRAQTRHHDYGQLIEFVRPCQFDDRTWKELPASKNPSLISGDEARSFYEDLCADSDSDKRDLEKTGLRTSKTTSLKRCYPHQRKKKTKRLCLEECGTYIDGMTGHYQASESAISSDGIDNQNQELMKKCTPCYGTSASGKSTCASKNCDSGNHVMKVNANQRLKDHRQAELFRLAQNGNTEDVRVLLQKGVDVNCTDQFGWTATMSAAYEGHVAVVQILVKAGADLTIRNTQGHTVLSLAQKKGHSQVVQFIEFFQRTGCIALRPRKKEEQYSRFYCDVCKSEFSDSNQSDHQRSTVHIFNTGQKPKVDSFLIPPSNVGYRLMMKRGWDGSRGLGPCGEGQRYPIKTVLKQDRKGLGNVVKDKAKVTHFKANDQSAVTRKQSEGDRRVASARTLSRRAQKVKERKERRWEINMRYQLS